MVSSPLSNSKNQYTASQKFPSQFGNGGNRKNLRISNKKDGGTSKCILPSVLKRQHKRALIKQVKAQARQAQAQARQAQEQAQARQAQAQARQAQEQAQAPAPAASTNTASSSGSFFSGLPWGRLK